MKRVPKMGELAWLFGTVLCALGVVLCTKADLGLSMFAAPPYIIHVVVQKYLPWYTQGTSEYIWQCFMLVVMCIIVCRVRLKYFLAFGVAMMFGFVIDGWLFVLGGSDPYASWAGRIIAFILGQQTISLSVAMVFRSYLPPQVPECLVMEIAQRYHKSVTNVKQVVDIICLILSFALSLVLTRGFTGVGIGTVIVTFINAPSIRLWGKLLDKFFTFEPMFPRCKAWLDKR